MIYLLVYLLVGVGCVLFGMRDRPARPHTVGSIALDVVALPVAVLALLLVSMFGWIAKAEVKNPFYK